MRAKITISQKDKPIGSLLERLDYPDRQDEISQADIVALATAEETFRVARAEFEAKRAALALKLLYCIPCEEGDYFARLDEHHNIVIEDHTSLEPETRRPIVDLQSFPSGGAA